MVDVLRCITMLGEISVQSNFCARKGAIVALRQAMRNRKSGGVHKRLPPALFLTDQDRCEDPFAVAGRLPPGTGVVLRDYRHPERRELAQRLAAICSQRGLVFLVGGDPRLAGAVGARGLHLPERLIDRFAFNDLGPGMLLTVAVHSREAMMRAAEIGADAILLSPLFRTVSHPHIEPLGLHRFAALLQESKVPVYALGGLTKKNIRALPHSERLVGYAGISIFMTEE